MITIIKRPKPFLRKIILRRRKYWVDVLITSASYLIVHIPKEKNLDHVIDEKSLNNLETT